MISPTPINQRKYMLLFALWIVVGFSSVRLFAQSYIVTQTETSDPPNLFSILPTQTNCPPGAPAILFHTQTAPTSVNGYQFTEWTVNGLRAQDFTSNSINPAPTLFTNNVNIIAIAHYLPASQYTADTLVPDWYKVAYFGTTNINASANPSQDGFSIWVDYLRGYDPLLFNQIVEGGISRRRSATTLVVVNTNLVQVSATSQPFGLYATAVQILTKGTNYSLPAMPSYSGYGFTGWFVGTNRVDNSQGFSTGTLNFTISNNTTFVAEFLPSGQDSDGDLIPDWYEMYYFNSLTNTGTSNPSGDGFSIATDILRGYQPNVSNQIVEGGISRRRSASALIVVNTNLVQVSATSQPFGLYSTAVQILTKGTNYSLPAMPSYSGYGFTGWFVGTNRVDNSQGFSSGTLNFTISNNTTFVAEFLPSGQDSDGDGVPDWYEIYYFNSLTNSGTSNPSGDGFNIATDILRGYQPNVFNQIIEGGVSRRRSPTFPFVPAPPGITTQPQDQTVPPGTNVLLTVTPQGIPPFTYQWLLNGIPIFGATNSSLTITNAQPINGGSFSVRVFNTYGWIDSNPGQIVIASPDLGLADDFYAAPIYTTNNFIGSGNNTNATEQSGEPNHDGKNGTHSLWMVWQATAAGIISFSSQGSSFDTVLAVYTNGVPVSPVNLTNLIQVAADDDSGPYLTSALQFNTTAGTTYYVALDGFQGASGNIVLGWQFTPTNAVLPQIVQQPLSVVAGVGQTASFSVVAIGSGNLTYQWFVDNVSVANATNATLTITNVQTANVGNYVVLVSNGNELVLSLPAFLQINDTDGTVQQVAAVYKLGESVTLAPPPQPHGIGGAPVRGFSGTQVLSTKATPTTAAYFAITAPAYGNMLVTTEGSGFATILTVYSGPTNAVSLNQLTNLSEAANSGSDHLTSRLACTVQSNQTYVAEVEGAKGASGQVTISWEVPYQQAIELPGTNQPIGTAVLAIQTTNAAPQSVQWLFDQQPLAGATNLTLTLNNISTSEQGFYSVNLAESNGFTNHDLVFLQVLPLPLNAQFVKKNNALLLYFGTTYGRAVEIQSSSNLINWVPVYTNNTPGTNNFFTNSLSTGQSSRFYRLQFP